MTKGRSGKRNQTPLRIGPLRMRLSDERDPDLRNLTDAEGVKRGLELMAFSLDRLWESVAHDLGTRDEKRIASEVRRLLAKFSRADAKWRELRSKKRSAISRQRSAKDRGGKLKADV
jgi:hypothetical protein